MLGRGTGTAWVDCGPKVAPQAVTALLWASPWAQTLSFLAQNQQLLQGPPGSMLAGHRIMGGDFQ